jgi:glycosyltransferase involved in cell wall biosynthesis
VRIALLTETLAGGGAEAIVRGLATGLAQRGHRAFVYCLKNTGTPPDQLAAAGVIVRDGGSNGRDPLLAARLLRWFRQDAIEVANSHTSAAVVWALPAARVLRIPLVQTRHGGLFGRPTRYTRLANLASPLLDAVTIVAEPLRNTLPRQLARRAICVPNGRDLGPVAPPDAREALGRLCGRPLIGPVVLSVGTICPEKDVCNLLRAFALLRLELLDATLVHIGPPRSPAYSRLVKAQARRLGLDEHVIFGGAVSEPWRMMAGADVFCLSSATEAMPLVVIEAMIQRVPIVATAVGAVGRLDEGSASEDGRGPDTLIVHRQSGLLVPPGDPRALAEALQQALRDRRAAARRAQRALADYRRLFSSGPMVSRYERLYARLIGQRKLAPQPNPAPPRRPNVLLVGPGPHQIGGMTSVIDALMSGPLRERFMLHRYWPRAGTVQDLTPRPGPLNRAVSAARHLAALTELARTIRRTRSQIVHVHTCSSFSFYRSLVDVALARLHGCRTCVHIHGGRFDEFCADSGAVARWIIRRGCELTDAVFVLAPYWASRLRPFLGKAQIHAVANGVAVSRGAPRRPKSTSHTCRFVYLGALCARKGLNELLAAAGQMRAAGVPFELVLAGPVEPPTQNWEESVRQLGLEKCVQFAGIVAGARKSELLESADCLVLPSHQEGLPMVLLEAATAGLPVIATNVGAIPEFLQPPTAGPGFHAEEELIAPMVSPGDADALAREMIRVARDPRLRDRIGRRLHAHVREEYSLERMAERMAAVYGRMLGVPRAAADGPPTELSASRRSPGERLADSGLAHVPTRGRVARSGGRPKPEFQVQTK